MSTFDYYLDKALDLGKKSYFTSKAQQKDALDYLNRAYDCLRDTKVRKGSTPQERWLETRDLPMFLHYVKEKHRTVFENLSIDCDLVYKLVQCRNEYKNFDIVKPTTKYDKNTALNTGHVVQLINDTVGYTKEYPNESQRNLEHYIGKDLWKRVSYTWHFVTNSQGTKFIRVFWFLDGNFTKLSKILSLRG
tara:strand:+ start:2456 stop:3028 length:573 start_codon:yes stop_codon:yes gene_type:complete